MDRANEVSLTKPMPGLGRQTTPLASTPAASSQARTLGLTRLQRVCKRAFDVVFAVLIFILFWWAIVAVAVILRVSTGRHVIFSHMRVGRGGRDFKCFKFRSMVPNSDELLADLLASDAEARAEWERDFKLKNDPRITRFGRFIRRSSLDEFPQLWNVIRGEMSIVGPRPVVRKELELYYADALEHYKAVKPGLTGLWQVSGRNDMEYSERVALDCAYVESWSVLSDLKIVVRTVGVVFRRSGAY